MYNGDPIVRVDLLGNAQIYLTKEDIEAGKRYEESQRAPSSSSVDPRINYLSQRIFTLQAGLSAEGLTKIDKEVCIMIPSGSKISSQEIKNKFGKLIKELQDSFDMGAIFMSHSLLRLQAIVDKLPAILDRLVAKGALAEEMDFIYTSRA